MINIEKIVSSMSVEELVSQVLSYNIEAKDTKEETIELLKRTHPGCIYYGDFNNCKSMDELEELVKLHHEYEKIAKENSEIPVFVSTDIEHGPGAFCNLLPSMPSPMAWGAANDEKLIERAGELTAIISRKLGLHSPLDPVVDLNYNFQNPIVNIRAISDEPDRIIRLAGAYQRGLQKHGYLSSCPKHFPGDGVDDRNAHFMTNINKLSKEEWMNTYGKVYKNLFNEGAMSVMVGHISEPAFQGCVNNPNDALPCTLSKELMTDLLKNELGFKGCIISDAMSMIGAVAASSLDNLAIDYINAGGDMILFPEKDDFERLIKATNDGRIKIERLRDAARRVLKLKEATRCFEEEKVQKELEKYSFEELSKELSDISQKISDCSIKVLRDRKEILPLPLIEKAEKGRALVVTLWDGFFNKAPSGKELAVLKKEIEKRGYQVDYLTNAKHKLIHETMNDYDFIVVGLDMSCLNYSGASMRMNWNVMMTFWRGYILEHPRLIVVSFGDPYRLYDMPYLSNYINAFGDSAQAQKSVAKVIFGEIEAKGKNPVRLEGFFEREE